MNLLNALPVTQTNYYYLCQVNEVNGGDTVFIRRVSVYVCVCVCTQETGQSD